MNDQATTMCRSSATGTLEIEYPELLSDTTIEETGWQAVNSARCIAVTSGKGGVGKSNFAVNVALELGSLGNRVSLLDADFGLANIDLLCGVSPKFHLGHVITGNKDLEDVAVEIGENVHLIPGGSGIEELANISLIKNTLLLAKLRKLQETSDFMVIDTAAGIAENVSGVLRAASEIIVVTTPDPTSVVNAYATIKVIVRNSPAKQISIIVNNVVGVGEAEQVFQQLKTAANKFLQHKIEFLGMIPHDLVVSEAVRDQNPVVKHSPSTPASRAIRLIARQLHKQLHHGFAYPMEAQSFWHLLSENN
ncbi:MAG: MinD/ParA family protein [Pyrinomonadaceae bacterium]